MVCGLRIQGRRRAVVHGMEGTMTRTSTLFSYEVDQSADPDVHVYRFEDTTGEYVVISILRDMENQGTDLDTLRFKDSLRIKMPLEHFQELMTKGEEVLPKVQPE